MDRENLILPHHGVLSPGRDAVDVEVILEVPDVAEEDGGHGEKQREEPDERDEDGVGPGAGDEAVLPGEVPLAVLHEEVPGQEQQRQGQEEQEREVRVSGINT